MFFPTVFNLDFMLTIQRKNFRLAYCNRKILYIKVLKSVNPHIYACFCWILRKKRLRMHGHIVHLRTKI